jgi:hypothetical protein
MTGRALFELSLLGLLTWALIGMIALQIFKN